MKIITVNLTAPHVRALQMLQDLGLYPSRSEAIRGALKQFLEEEFGLQGVGRDDAPPAPRPATKDTDTLKREMQHVLRLLRNEVEAVA